jgi:hypothetical protein
MLSELPQDAELNDTGIIKIGAQWARDENLK